MKRDQRNALWTLVAIIAMEIALVGCAPRPEGSGGQDGAAGAATPIAAAFLRVGDWAFYGGAGAIALGVVLGGLGALGFLTGIPLVGLLLAKLAGKAGAIVETGVIVLLLGCCSLYLSDRTWLVGLCIAACLAYAMVRNRACLAALLGLGRHTPAPAVPVASTGA